MPEEASPFLDFLIREGEELRRRLLWCVAAFGLVSALLLGAPSWEHSYALGAVSFLQASLLPAGTKLVFLDPLEPMLVVFKVSLLLSMLLTAPLLIWHFLAFTAPAFAKGLRAYYMRFTVAAIFLFSLGFWLTYRYMLPLTLKMLMDYGVAAGGTPLITFDRFYSFSMLVLLAFALPFEMPLLMSFMHRFNIMDVKTFKSWRWKAYGVFMIVSEFVTPDPLITPLIFIGLSVLLYEGGIVLAKRF
jgi:sec-independent protein translocase protein TatC